MGQSVPFVRIERLKVMAADKAKVLKIVKTVVNVLVWIFVIFAVLVTIVVLSASANKDGSGMASIGGYCPINILTESMEPTIKKGDLIISRSVNKGDENSLQVGDIITFTQNINGQAELNTHRIIEVETLSDNTVRYITHGDNNPDYSNETVMPKDVKALWSGTRIGGIGNFIEFLRSKTGFLVCIVLPLVAFFGYEVFNFVRTLLQVRGYGKRATALDEEAIKRRAIAEYLASQQAGQMQSQQDKAEQTETEAKPAEAGEKTPEPGADAPTEDPVPTEDALQEEADNKSEI